MGRKCPPCFTAVTHFHLPDIISDPNNSGNLTLSETFSATTAYVEISGTTISFTKDYITPQAFHPISGRLIVRAVSRTSKSILFLFLWLRQYKLTVHRTCIAYSVRTNLGRTPFQYELKLCHYHPPVSPSWSLYGPPCSKPPLSCRFHLSKPKVKQVHALKPQRKYRPRRLSRPRSIP